MTSKPREVTKVISSADAFEQTRPVGLSLHIEVKQKANGEWRVFYPDPGWISCPPDCSIKHKHDYDPAWVESTYQPMDYEDALAWAEKMAEKREIVIVPFVPINQRKRL